MDYTSHFNLCLILYSYVVLLIPAPTNGELRLVGSSQPVTARVGEDVILPCYVQPAINVEGLTVLWTKGQDPDPQKKPHRTYVHFHRDGRDVFGMKHPSYTGRTSLFLDELIKGNVSLKLLKVEPSDEGSYRCFLPKLQSQETRNKETTVILHVDTSPQKLAQSEPRENQQQMERERGEETLKSHGNSSENPQQSDPVILAVTVVAAAVTALVLVLCLTACYIRKRKLTKPSKEAPEAADFLGDKC
ncbi:myelin-oligodendrocyte glycoprotein-like [Polymixia lowei]